MTRRQTLKRGDLVTIGTGRKLKGIVFAIHDSKTWPAATIYIFEEDKKIRVNQNLFSLEKVT